MRMFRFKPKTGYRYEDKDKRWVRVYTLDDGSKWTVRMVQARIPSSGSCARARLEKHTDPKKIFRPVRSRVKAEGKFVNRSDMLDGYAWYKDPLVRLLMKNI